MGKKKFYVVWHGVSPGIYTSWTDCKLQINGFEGAIYKSFDTQEEAERAYNTSPYLYILKKKTTAPAVSGPVYGTNNIGEFLAIVHALALMEQKNIRMPVFSDSRNAIGWVKQKRCKTKLERSPRTEALYQMIERAETWLKTHKTDIPILKWETERWGEVPADFGRK